MSGIMVDLNGKNALITGAGKGIGRAIALSLARSGARIFAVSRTEADLKKLKKEIELEKGICVPLICDVSSIESIGKMAEAVAEKAGYADIVVNSAGINIQSHTLEISEDQWDLIMNTNLKGSFFVSQAMAKLMKDHGAGGKIIFITSQMSFVGFFRRTAYCASKGGITQAAKAMAVELAEYNIKVNCVAPTFLKTPMTEPMLQDKMFYDEVMSRIPLGKIGTPEDVTGAVLYLASDSADLVTGTTILVDGGWTAW